MAGVHKDEEQQELTWTAVMTRREVLRKKIQAIKNPIQMIQKMRSTAVKMKLKIITRMKQMMHRNKVIMNVYIPLYLFQRAVKVSGLKFLSISIYLPPSLASNLNI